MNDLLNGARKNVHLYAIILQDFKKLGNSWHQLDLFCYMRQSGLRDAALVKGLTGSFAPLPMTDNFISEVPVQSCTILDAIAKFLPNSLPSCSTVLPR